MSSRAGRTSAQRHQSRMPRHLAAMVGQNITEAKASQFWLWIYLFLLGLVVESGHRQGRERPNRPYGRLRIRRWTCLLMSPPVRSRFRQDPQGMRY